MLTYRARPRAIKFDPGPEIITPASATVTFVLSPGQAFGIDRGGGRTAVRAVEGSVLMNRCTGQWTVESARPLAPLDVTINDSDMNANIAGNKLTISKTVGSKRELQKLIEAIYYCFPVVIAPLLSDPPVIIDVTGTVNGHAFGWNLVNTEARITTTTQDQQVEHIRKSWNRLARLIAPVNRRLMAALHYFHVATRLDRVAESPGEFLGEALLNYAKVLEVLFSPSTKVMRTQLRSIGIDESSIERDFLPAAILRSKLT